MTILWLSTTFLIAPSSKSHRIEYARSKFIAVKLVFCMSSIVAFPHDLHANSHAAKRSLFYRRDWRSIESERAINQRMMVPSALPAVVQTVNEPIRYMKICFDTRGKITYRGGKPRFVCGFRGCRKSYKTEENLAIHQRKLGHTVAANGVPETTTCDVCGESFLCDNFRRHQVETGHRQNDADDKPNQSFMCDWEGCGKAYSRRQGLNQYQRDYGHTPDKKCT